MHSEELSTLLAVLGQRAARTSIRRHLVPDWRAVAERCEGVHLSWAGFITTEGCITDLGHGDIALLRYWFSERRTASPTSSVSRSLPPTPCCTIKRPPGLPRRPTRARLRTASASAVTRCTACLAAEHGPTPVQALRVSLEHRSRALGIAHPGVRRSERDVWRERALGLPGGTAGPDGGGWVRASVLPGEGGHAGPMDGVSAADDQRRRDVSAHLEADIAGEADRCTCFATCDPAAWWPTTTPASPAWRPEPGATLAFVALVSTWSWTRASLRSRALPARGSLSGSWQRAACPGRPCPGGTLLAWKSSKELSNPVRCGGTSLRPPSTNTPSAAMRG